MKKLHKLLYYCQGHHLAATGEPVFREAVSAWDMGPVVERLWKQEQEGVHHPPGATLSEDRLNTIGYVVSRYGKLSGKDLEHLTHSETPWQRANADRPPGQSARIDREWMRDYFASAAEYEREEDEHTDGPVVRAWLGGAEDRRSTALSEDTVDELRRRLSRAT